MFTVTDGVLLKPLPYVGEQNVAYPDFLDLKRATRWLAMAGWLYSGGTNAAVFQVADRPCTAINLSASAAHSAPPSDRRRIRLTASVRRCQLAVSVSSCDWPFRVRR